MSPLFNFAVKNLRKSRIRSGLSILAVFLGVLLITTLLVMTDSLVAAVDDSLDLLSGVVVLQQKEAVNPNFSIVSTQLIDSLVNASHKGGLIEGSIESVVKEIWYVEKSDTGVFGLKQIIGFVPSKEKSTVGLLNETNIQSGRTLSDTDYNATVIGSTFAFALNLHVGDFVEIKAGKIEVVGIFSTDSFLDTAMFMNIELVKTFSPQYTSGEFVSTALIKPTNLEAGGIIKS